MAKCIRIGPRANPPKPNTELRRFLRTFFRKEPKPLILKSWLGGLDSNQDNQIQNLMYCQLYDLPAEGRQQKRAVGTTLNYFTDGT